MDGIIESINAIYKISDQSVKLIASHLKVIKLSKKTILVEPGRKNNNVYFISKGIARSYNLIDGKEITSWFSKEGELIYSTNSFYGTTEGYENEMVQLLEDSVLYYMSIDELEELCKRQNDIANWLRVLHQKAFVEMERRLIYRLYMSAEERYKDFYDKYPKMFQRVNLGYIASYLGMSHVTLCALRK